MCHFSLIFGHFILILCHHLIGDFCVIALFAVFDGAFFLETLPKALRTQGLTALTSNFGLVGLVQYAWFCLVGLI